MNHRINLLVGALAATMLIGSGAAALANTVMGSEATLYSAPHGQDLDNTIDKGDSVTVGKCQAGYCYVHDLDDDDSDGWVKSATIDFTSTTDNDDDDDATDVSPNDNGSLIDLSGLTDFGSRGHHHK
jgi:hypothetical protein